MNSKIYALTVFILSLMLTSANAQQLSRSEALLSGLEQIPMAMVGNPKLPDSFWPDQIEVPQGWRDGFKELIRLTKETGQEHGACLSVLQKQGAAYAQAQLPYLLAYEKLMGERANLSKTDFELRTAQIRAHVEKLSLTKGAQQLEWVLGAYIKGNETSLTIDLDITTCANSFMGDVHTHPAIASDAEPSDTDILDSVAHRYPSQTNNFNLSTSGEVCTTIVSQRFQIASTNSSSRFYTGSSFLKAHLSSIFSRHIASGRRALVKGEDSLRLKLIANFIVPYNAAIYCGQLDKSLVRIQPSPLPHVMQNEASVLAIKAAIAAKKYAYAIPAPEISFDFSPVFDSALVTHLETHSKKRYTNKELPDFLEQIRARDADALLTEELSDGKYGYFDELRTGFSAPKYNRNGFDAASQHYVTYVITDSKSDGLFRASLSIQRNDSEKAKRGIYEAVDLRVFARWEQSDGSSLTINPDTGLGTEYFPKLNQRINCQYVWKGSQPVRSGKCEVETDLLKIMGTMRDGQFEGPVRRLDKATGQWTTVTLQK